MSEHSQAVPPVLGSALLTTTEAEKRLLRGPLSCGLASIDNLVLDGGFRYGEIASIAGATATGKTLVSFLFSDKWSEFKGAAFEDHYRLSFTTARAYCYKFLDLTHYRTLN